MGLKALAEIEQWLAAQDMHLRAETKRTPAEGANARHVAVIWDRAWSEHREVKYPHNWHMERKQRITIAEVSGLKEGDETSEQALEAAIGCYLQAEENGGVWPEDKAPSMWKFCREIQTYLQRAAEKPDYNIGHAPETYAPKTRTPEPVDDDDDVESIPWTPPAPKPPKPAAPTLMEMVDQYIEQEPEWQMKNRNSTRPLSQFIFTTYGVQAKDSALRSTLNYREIIR